MMFMACGRETLGISPSKMFEMMANPKATPILIESNRAVIKYFFFIGIFTQKNCYEGGGGGFRYQPMVSKIAKSSSVVKSRFSSITVWGLPATLTAKVNLPIFIRFAKNVSV